MSKNTLILSRSIEKSMSEVTVLFTDIVDSTKFWDKHGDTAGRLMLDRHNKLLFPVVDAYRGTLIKTIGDSIMASFKSPMDGVKAAIAMQQLLQLARNDDKTFNVHIRIGVHTGQAIVESKDVFGDTVNVAARVESAAGTDEILVSEATAQRLKKKKTEYGLKDKRTFVPKGKNKRLSVWVCDWTGVRNLTQGISRVKMFPPNKRQKIELGVYFAVSVTTIFFLYREYLRYMPADTEMLAPYFAPLHSAVLLLFAGIIAVSIVFLARYYRKISKPPIWMFRILKGGCLFGVVFFLSVFIAESIDLQVKPYWNAPLHQSSSRFVEIVADDVVIQQLPALNSPKVMVAHRGDIYLLKNKVKKKRRVYARVAINHETRANGFILEQEPPKLGVPAIQQIEQRRLVFTYYHLYALLLGLFAFLYGIWSFRIRPL